MPPEKIPDKNPELSENLMREIVQSALRRIDNVSLSSSDLDRHFGETILSRREIRLVNPINQNDYVILIFLVGKSQETFCFNL